VIMLRTVKGYKNGHHLLCEGGVYYVSNIDKLPNKDVYALLYSADGYTWYALNWYTVYESKQ